MLPPNLEPTHVEASGIPRDILQEVVEALQVAVQYQQHCHRLVMLSWQEETNQRLEIYGAIGQKPRYGQETIIIVNSRPIRFDFHPPDIYYICYRAKSLRPVTLPFLTTHSCAEFLHHGLKNCPDRVVGK
jgi:hypothetical protein